MTGSKEWVRIAEEHLDTFIRDYSPIGGSSSGDTLKINTDLGSFFIKIAPYLQLEAEYLGLNTLHEKAGIRTPVVYGLFHLNNGKGVMILEFITSRAGPPNSTCWDSFLAMLQHLHAVKSESYGWETANFIGRLDQPNGYSTSWSEFFIEKRLNEQWLKGLSEGSIPQYLESTYERFISRAKDELENIEIRPSLLHGDLWSGNIIFDQHGEAVFIDPSVYYGHGEVDLAMMDLFGGFPPYLTETYLEGHIPAGYEKRKLIYQLYYQLVHVRLFGAGYLGAVERIINI